MAAFVVGIAMLGRYGGKPIYIHTGDVLAEFESADEWVATKQRAGIVVRSAESMVLLPYTPHAKAFVEPRADGDIVTVFVEASLPEEQVRIAAPLYWLAHQFGHGATLSQVEILRLRQAGYLDHDDAGALALAPSARQELANPLHAFGLQATTHVAD